MPDEVDGVRWIGYGGPHPRKTGVREFRSFLQSLTGLEKPPQTDREWLPHLTRVNFLGRSWTEQLFRRDSGRSFPRPGRKVHATMATLDALRPSRYSPSFTRPVAFRIWNAGPEYNLKRMAARRDRAAFELCRSRFMNEVLKLAFCWNEQFIPPLQVARRTVSPAADLSVCHSTGH